MNSPASHSPSLPHDHAHDLSPWQHSHVFDAGNRSGEARTRVVLVVTLLTMVAEIFTGWWSGSMALLADGWHMGTHALALGVAAFAYALARRHARDARFAFGTWKIEVLGSFASAMVLGLVAIGILFESAMRLYRAEPIALDAALIVAVVGLVINLLSAWLLHGADGHGHDHGHDHGHAHPPTPKAAAHEHAHHGHDPHEHRDPSHDDVHHHHAQDDVVGKAAGTGGHDMNLRAAYIHVLADAMTSVLAIAALLGAMWLGWWWLDPLVGVLGAVVIGIWSIGLMRQSGSVLLDREMDHPLTAQVRAEIESDGDAKVADLHLWRIGRDQFAAIVCVVADAPQPPSFYRERLHRHAQLAHVSVEVNRCPNVG